MVTTTTVGYGDIKPTNTDEKTFTILLMLLGCIMFSYTIGSLGSIFGQIDTQSSIQHERILYLHRIRK